MQKQADAVPGLCVADRYEPTCFEELTQALSDFEHDRAGFAEEVAIRVFEIVARHRA